MLAQNQYDNRFSEADKLERVNIFYMNTYMSKTPNFILLCEILWITAGLKQSERKKTKKKIKKRNISLQIKEIGK